uniref:Uncharacterized protein n=1 Tax=Steinernema glaseri TaxID=37863 RepID=A0A1I7YJM7_9BILA
MSDREDNDDFEVIEVPKEECSLFPSQSFPAFQASPFLTFKTPRLRPSQDQENQEFNENLLLSNKVYFGVLRPTAVVEPIGASAEDHSSSPITSDVVIEARKIFSPLPNVSESIVRPSSTSAQNPPSSAVSADCVIAPTLQGPSSLFPQALSDPDAPVTGRVFFRCLQMMMELQSKQIGQHVKDLQSSLQNLNQKVDSVHDEIGSLRDLMRTLLQEKEEKINELGNLSESLKSKEVTPEDLKNIRSIVKELEPVMEAIKKKCVDKMEEETQDWLLSTQEKMDILKAAVDKVEKDGKDAKLNKENMSNMVSIAAGATTGAAFLAKYMNGTEGAIIGATFGGFIGILCAQVHAACRSKL